MRTPSAGCRSDLHLLDTPLVVGVSGAIEQGGHLRVVIAVSSA